VPKATFTAADLAYLFESYLPLAELCEGRPETPDEVERLISQGRLPKPSYVLGDGTGLFPGDYFELVDQAGGVEPLESDFRARHAQAWAKEHAHLDAVDADWQAYLDGTYGICLREVTPEAIVRKSVLVSSLCELLMLARPRSRDWRDKVRDQVDELDRLERRFAPDYERAEWNERPPTRDLLVRFARHRYPSVFADG
jgi:hypothetical protein